MLLQLSIRNIVLIERLVLELTPGFNAITGETGAGKSMVVDALSLVLGGRARPELVRSGADEAEVEALFELSPSSRVAAKLDAGGIPGERELVVRRVVQAEGRSRAYINGRICTASQLADLAADLCDIASQHESVALTDPSTHIEYLDAFGRLEADRARMAEQVDALATVVRELDAVSAQERGRAEREDFLNWQIREIDELEPRDGEETELASERARLRHADKLQVATRGAAERLYEGEGAACDELARVSAELDQAAAIDGSLALFARTIESARAELADAARALARYADSVEASPERLQRSRSARFACRSSCGSTGRPPPTSLLIAPRSLASSRRSRTRPNESRSSSSRSPRGSPKSRRPRARSPGNAATPRSSWPTQSVGSSPSSGWVALGWSSR